MSGLRVWQSYLQAPRVAFCSTFLLLDGRKKPMRALAWGYAAKNYGRKIRHRRPNIRIQMPWSKSAKFISFHSCGNNITRDSVALSVSPLYRLASSKRTICLPNEMTNLSSKNFSYVLQKTWQIIIPSICPQSCPQLFLGQILPGSKV